MFALQAVLVVFVGWFAKSMVEKRPFNVSKTTIRKCFQGTANFGLAISLILVTFNNCDLIYLGIVLQLVSFLSMFVAGGETMLPYDLSDEFPATIAAVANSVANISGIVTTGLATWIVGKQGGSMTRWHKLIYLYSGANFVGGLAFSIFVKAEPIDSDSSKRKSTFETDIEPNAIMVEPISYKQVETTPTYNVAEQSKEVGTQDKVPDATETKKTP